MAKLQGGLWRIREKEIPGITELGERALSGNVGALEDFFRKAVERGLEAGKAEAEKEAAPRSPSPWKRLWKYLSTRN